MEMTPVDPTISSASGRIGFARMETPCVPRSNSASSPSVVVAIIVTSDHFVLQTLYSHATATTAGAANNVDFAMIVLARPILRPSATNVPGSHSSTPKFTSPQASAAKVSAIVVPTAPGTWGGSGGWPSALSSNPASAFGAAATTAPNRA